MTKSNYIFLRALARFNPQNWQLDSLLLVFWWWFALAIRLFVTRILVVVCSGLRWFAVVCLIVIPVDRMHPDTNGRRLFKAASSRCVWALRYHTGEQSAGANAVVDVWSKQKCAPNCEATNRRSKLTFI